MANVEKMIAETFLEMAQGLESGSYGKRPKIALTGMGSEHGEENAMEAALMAAKDGVDVYYIGSLEAEGVTTVKVADDEEGHKKMEEMLANGEVDGAVTMHFPFPIGVSTVGRVVTPAKGREMFVANTTGTSSADRIEGMIKNTIYGIIAAKTCGIANPTVGILNVDGARQTEKALKELQENGYDITFAESARADGGCVMRGNDVLQGTPDIMVTDSLTGNIMVKMLSSAATGGSFEATGYGYGPGIGEGYEQLVMIVSRASGAPVIAGAIRYAAQLVRNKVFEVAKAEFAAAKKAGLKKILDARKAANDNKIVINTNLKMGLPLENINKIAGPMIEAWAGEVFAGIRDEANNEYCLINVEAQERLGMADIILQFRKEDSVLTGNIDVKATANDIPNSGKGPNITSFSRIRTAYVKDPDFMFIILSIKHRVYSERNRNTGLVDGVMEVVDYNAYDLKFISDADINYNPALGTGQIQIKDIHYVTYQYRTTWEMCQLLDQKYLHSSRRTIDDFYREATRNQWIKS